MMTSAADTPSSLCMSTGIPRPLSSTETEPSAFSSIRTRSQWPASASSIALSTRTPCGGPIIVGIADIHARPLSHRVEAPRDDQRTVLAVAFRGIRVSMRRFPASLRCSRPYPAYRRIEAFDKVYEAFILPAHPSDRLTGRADSATCRYGMLSILDIFHISIGPSSSFRSARCGSRCASCARWKAGLLERTARVAELQGSLALTGGHGTVDATILGLAGFRPDRTDPDEAAATLKTIRETGQIALGNKQAIAFERARDIDLAGHIVPDLHPNGMRLSAGDADGAVLLERTYYSTGGGPWRARRNCSASPRTIACVPARACRTLRIGGRAARPVRGAVAPSPTSSSPTKTRCVRATRNGGARPGGRGDGWLHRSRPVPARHPARRIEGAPPRARSVGQTVRPAAIERARSLFDWLGATPRH